MIRAAEGVRDRGVLQVAGLETGERGGITIKPKRSSKNWNRMPAEKAKNLGYIRRTKKDKGRPPKGWERKCYK